MAGKLYIPKPTKETKEFNNAVEHAIRFCTGKFGHCVVWDAVGLSSVDDGRDYKEQACVVVECHRIPHDDLVKLASRVGGMLDTQRIMVQRYEKVETSFIPANK